MTKKPSTHPRGFRTVTASLAVYDICAVTDFLSRAFDAEVIGTDNDEVPGFATIKIGTSRLFLTLGTAELGHVPMPAGGVSQVTQHMYVEDVDHMVDQAAAAGATVLSAPVDTYWGERTATVLDPFGYRWTLATRTELLSEEEMSQRRQGWTPQADTAPDDATVDAAQSVQSEPAQADPTPVVG